MRPRHIVPAALCVVLAVTIACMATNAMASKRVAQTALPGASITKYLDAMPNFSGVRVGEGTGASVVGVISQEFQQPVLSSDFVYPAPFTGTWVWGYKVGPNPPFYPGFTIVANRNKPTQVTYLNRLGTQSRPPNLQRYLTVDQTIHWADPLMQMGSFNPYIGPQPVVTHLHGGEVPSAVDGHPDAWWTPGAETNPAFPRGSAFTSNVYTYPNSQEAATLWFHDHSLGITRLNVYAGLAAFYFLRGEPESSVTPALPSGLQEVEIVIQDRQFDTQGQLLFPDGFPAGLNGPPTNPTVNPFWNPEFIGDAIVVNGKTWPKFAVQPQRYRLRFLNGSNARFYRLQVPGVQIWVIGTDGGILQGPVPVTDLIIAPGERYDTILDFAPVAGTSIIMTNTAREPFPGGVPVDPATTGQIMRFDVAPGPVADASFNPVVDKALRKGNNNMKRLPGTPFGPALVLPPNPGANVDGYRQLTLNEHMGPGGPLEVLVNNSKWSGIRPNSPDIPPADQGTPIPGSVQVGNNWLTELPRQGATEVWDIINTTADTHPIHLHLVQFQIISRQTFDTVGYGAAYDAAFPGGVFIPAYGPPNNASIANADGALGGNPAVNGFRTGAPTPVKSYERGWKDTAAMHPGEVTRIVVRWAPTDLAVGSTVAGTNYYPFDPTVGPGYVWHCHILDHEDNEMMRPYVVTP
jgi:spore coat protein A, manganese oxidase